MCQVMKVVVVTVVGAVVVQTEQYGWVGGARKGFVVAPTVC